MMLQGLLNGVALQPDDRVFFVDVLPNERLRFQMVAGVYESSLLGYVFFIMLCKVC